MRTSPVSHIRIELLDDSLATLDGVKEDVENCTRMFNTWKRQHRADPNADLKQEVKESVDEMQTAFHAYREGVADKKKQLQPPAPAPVVGMTIKGEDEFKNMEQQELFNSEKARVIDGGEFSKF